VLDIKIDMTSRTFDKNSYNDIAKDFIPIACHYNENTLLTKNGELIQIIQIKGVNSEKISEKLFDVRKILHNSIKSKDESSKFAFWIHTIRSQTNLDDPAIYNNLLSSYIHDIWKRKNYWDSKFVNTLYVSIVHDSAKIDIKNISSFVNSMFFNILTSDFHDKYLENAAININNLTDKILLDLADLGSEKLGMRYDNERTISDLMSFYHRIIHMKEQECEVPIADLSVDLGSIKYTINSSLIESISNNQKKYASIISLKEYPDIKAEAFDEILQLPIEIIATEIFYFVPQKEIINKFKDFHYIVSLTKDTNLANSLRLNEIVDIKNTEINKFCYQQISMIIISTSQNNLQISLTQISKLLSKIAVQHVREDINLEQTFWSCLPGNFSFLKRIAPTFAENIGVLASLHNFPTGKQSSIWGRAITLLRTEKGTPYFLNFHDKNDKANCYIFGLPKTGKTTLTNFLISESTKYDPSIIYITPNNDSKIFINALGGEWIEQETQIINPFLLDKNEDSENFIYEFLKIISNHYIIELSEIELDFLKSLKDKIFKLKKEKRIFSDILKNADFSSEAGKLIEEKLAYFMKDGIYNKLFDSTKLSFENSKIIGLNLYELSQNYFIEKNYPKERKYLDQFNKDILNQVEELK